MYYPLDHQLSAAEIENLAAQGESETVEFKAFFPGDRLAPTLAALANTRGGIVLVGVNDDGVIRGIPNRIAANSLASMNGTAASLFDGLPERIYSTGLVDVLGKTVLYSVVGPVPPGYGPILSSAGEFFVRVGTRTTVHAVTLESLPTEDSTHVAGEVPATAESIHLADHAPLELFVAMSFRNEEEPALEDYYTAMQRASRTVDRAVHVYRMDEIDGSYEITQEIFKKIDESDIVLADFTLQSRNVYLELGYARGKGRPVILTARRDTVLEFDVSTWKTYFYRNATQLEAILPGALRAAVLEADAKKRI